MNTLVIVFVPANATKQDIKAALQESLASVDGDGSSTRTKPDEKPSGTEEPPFWTWFLPNPCP